MDPRFCQKILQNYFFRKKIEVFEIQNFNKISSFTIDFLFLQNVWHFFCLFHLSELVKKLRNFLQYFIRGIRVFINEFQKFLCFFILWIRDFIQDFWKIMEHFSKKYRHLKSKILQKFHYLLFVFFNYFFRIFDVFFSYFT